MSPNENVLFWRMLALKSHAELLCKQGLNHSPNSKFFLILFLQLIYNVPVKNYGSLFKRLKKVSIEESRMHTFSMT